MSSLASLFNSSAMLFTIDFYKRFRPNTPEKKLVTIGQMATVVIVILGILWIPIMRSVGDVLYTYLQDVQSVLAPGIAAAFLLGICWKRTTAQGGMWGLIAGMVIGMTRLSAKVYYSNNPGAADNLFKYLFYDVNWLFFCGWMLVICLALIIVINLWHGVPYTILQTSGILMNIPRDLYESSKIDGAGTVTQFTKITMPYIFFVTGPSLIQTFIGNINNFGVIYFLTGGGPAASTPISNAPGQTDLLITYIYDLVVTAQFRDYGLASVIGIIVFVICAFISIVMYNRSSAISREDQFQ